MNTFLGFLSICLYLSVSHHVHGAALQAALLQPLTISGSVHVMEVLESTQGAVHDAVEAFKPINETCNTILTEKTIQCANCIRSRCEARIEHLKKACAPSANILDVAVLLLMDFSKEIGKLLLDKLPNLIVDSLGGHLIDAGQEIGKFFAGTLTDGLQQLGKELGNLGGDLGNLVLDLGGVLENVGKQLINGIGDVGKEIIGGTLDLAQTLGKEVGNLLGNVGDLGGQIFKGIGKIFGRRRRALVRRRSDLVRYLRHMYLSRGEPGCNDFGNEDQAREACMYYATVCPTCNLDKDRDCPGYKEAWDLIVSTSQEAQWMGHIDDLKFGVLSVNYDPQLFDPQAIGYRNVQVEVDIFGLRHSLVIAEAVNIFDAQTAGEIIAQNAIEWFKRQFNLLTTGPGI